MPDQHSPTAASFLSWVINLPRSRFLVIADRHLGTLDQVAGELAHLERVVVHATEGPQDGPDPSLPWEPFAALLAAGDAEPGRGGVVDRRRPHHVHLRHHGPLARARSSSTPRTTSRARTYNEVCGVTEEDTFFSCLPLFHSNAQVLAAYPAMIAGARVALGRRATRRPASGARWSTPRPRS